MHLSISYIGLSAFQYLYLIFSSQQSWDFYGHCTNEQGEAPKGHSTCPGSQCWWVGYLATSLSFSSAQYSSEDCPSPPRREHKWEGSTWMLCRSGIRAHSFCTLTMWWALCEARPSRPYQLEANSTLFLQIWKVRLIDRKWLVQGHSAIKKQDWGLNPG